MSMEFHLKGVKPDAQVDHIPTHDDSQNGSIHIEYGM